MIPRSDFASIPWWNRIPTIGDCEHRPIEWLVKGFIPAGAFILLVGRPGSYKSWLSLDIARSVASGTMFAQMPTRSTEVLYVDMENGENLVAARKRMLGIKDVPGLRYGSTRCPAPSIRTGWAASSRVPASSPARTWRCP